MFDGIDADFASFINLAGRQRMLAHRILLLIALRKLENGRSDSERSFSAALAQARRMFLQSHDALMAERRRLSVLGLTLCAPAALAAVERFHGWLVALDADAAGADAHDLLARTEDVLGPLIDGLNLIVADFEAVLRQHAGQRDRVSENAHRAVGQIAGELQGISSKIQLIALNARIEAARHGAQGAAFAVIADEIKGLSEVSRRKAVALREHVGGSGG